MNSFAKREIIFMVFWKIRKISKFFDGIANFHFFYS